MSALTPDIVTSAIQVLPGRPPFMLAPPLAAFYGIAPKVVAQAVTRNPDRFPDDFCFTLTEGETEHLRSQNVTANPNSAPSVKARYAPLAFTEPGALALSGVLKTPRAAEVSVIVFRGFAQMRALEMRAAVYFARKASMRVRLRSRIAAHMATGADKGWSFPEIRAGGSTSWTVARLAETAHELLLLGEIAALPAGTPAFTPPASAETAADAPRQIDLFAPEG